MAGPKLVRLQYTGVETYRGADEELHQSLTVAPGEFVEVSEPKAAELTSDAEHGADWRVAPDGDKGSGRGRRGTPGKD